MGHELLTYWYSTATRPGVTPTDIHSPVVEGTPSAQVDRETDPPVCGGHESPRGGGRGGPGGIPGELATLHPGLVPCPPVSRSPCAQGDGRGPTPGATCRPTPV